MAKKAAKSPAHNLTGRVKAFADKRGTRRRIVFEVDTRVSKERFNVRAVEMARQFIEQGEEAVLLTTEDVE